ncbi:MAG: hypothetical protein Q8O74_04300, partial [bacterium]|nr:hypothetical protein [bacterium]
MKKLTNKWLNLFRFAAAAMIICCTGIIAYAQRPAIKPELMDREILVGNELESILPYFGAKGNVITRASNFIEYDQIKGVVKNDFLINDDTAGSCDQVAQAAAYGPDGSYVIVWSDRRSGFYDIYGQKFNSSGQLLGNEFKVNDNNEYVYNLYPSVSVGENSNMVITWEAMNLNN